MRVQPKNRWSNDVAKYDIPHLRLRQVAKLIRQYKPSSYTDLGCAKGTLRTLTPGIRYRGCDFVVPTTTYDFEFYACDFNNEELPLQVRDSELIVCSGLLEYIDNLPVFLKAINDSLAKDGRFLVTYFNMNHIGRIWDLIRGRSFRVHPDWRGFYSPDDFKRMLCRSGFSIEEIFTSSQSFKGSPPVSDTEEVNDELLGYHFYSKYFAHQIIVNCKKI